MIGAILARSKKTIRATVAKEVGMENPAEETTVSPNQNQNLAAGPPNQEGLGDGHEEPQRKSS